MRGDAEECYARNLDSEHSQTASAQTANSDSEHLSLSPPLLFSGKSHYISDVIITVNIMAWQSLGLGNDILKDAASHSQLPWPFLTEQHGFCSFLFYHAETVNSVFFASRCDERVEAQSSRRIGSGLRRLFVYTPPDWSRNVRKVTGLL